ncbi:MAG: hypothetical protein AVDCRST_MAG79-2506, partial [uncultured Thermoleophilia bacterium]
ERPGSRLDGPRRGPRGAGPRRGAVRERHPPRRGDRPLRGRHPRLGAGDRPQPRRPRRARADRGARGRRARPGAGLPGQAGGRAAV